MAVDREVVWDPRIVRRGANHYEPDSFQVGNRTVEMRNPYGTNHFQRLVDLARNTGQIEQITITSTVPTASLRGGLDGISPENLAQVYKQVHQRDGGEQPIQLARGVDVHAVVAAIADHDAPSGGVILVQPDFAPEATKPESKTKHTEDISVMRQATGIVGDGFKRAKQTISRRNRPDFRDPDVLKKMEKLSERILVRAVLIGDSEENKKLAQLLIDINVKPVHVLKTIYPENQPAELMPAIAAQYQMIVEMLERDASESTTA